MLLGWIATLRLYESDGLDEAKQYLRRWYELHTPTNVADVLGIEPSRSFLMADPLATTYPWSDKSPAQYKEIRENMMRVEAREFGLRSWRTGDGWKAHGPATEPLVKLEIGRLVRAYKALKQEGFNSKHGMIGGDLVVAGDEIMVIPRGAWHRTAALIALGETKLKIRYRFEMPVVRREEFTFWPNVANGLFTEDEALRIFDLQFRFLDIDKF